MAEHRKLPLKIGQLSESKSFIKGYRGAWFRCKIKDIRQDGHNFVYHMEYYDFPGENSNFFNIILYQKPRRGGNTKEEERELMVRPPYPKIYTERGSPSLETISEDIVISGRIWKVGDLVDWWKDSCFWLARVIEIISDVKVKVELSEPPLGEGFSYDVFCKDLRPSLQWSVELGWALPPGSVSRVFWFPILVFNAFSGRSMKDVAVLKPVGQGKVAGPSSISKSPRKKDLLKQGTAVFKYGLQYASRMKINMDKSHSDNRNKGCVDGAPSRNVKDGSAEAAGSISKEEEDHHSGSSKRIRLDKSILLNSMMSDSMESSFMDLEELVSRMKWLESILKSDLPLKDSAGPTWKFSEHVAVSTPRCP
ncbi:hypothetical protein AKJ16_DCAP17637 [Drosera capensis]